MILAGPRPDRRGHPNRGGPGVRFSNSSAARSGGSHTAAASRNGRAEEGILSARGPDRTGFIRRAALQSCVAPGRAQPGFRPLCDMRGLGGRDVAARNGCQNGRQHLSKILDHPQRRQLDPETRRRADGSERWRQELLGEGAQQLRLAVEEIRQACALSGRAARSGTRRLGLGMPRGRPCGLPSFPWRNARARRAREATRDQAQVIEIHQIAAWNTGDYRTRQADRQRFPASAVLQGKRAEHVGS